MRKPLFHLSWFAFLILFLVEMNPLPWPRTPCGCQQKGPERAKLSSAWPMACEEPAPPARLYFTPSAGRDELPPLAAQVVSAWHG